MIWRIYIEKNILPVEKKPVILLKYEIFIRVLKEKKQKKNNYAEVAKRHLN